MKNLGNKQLSMDVLVFPLFKSLKYKNRIILSSVLILAGFVYQIATFDILPGIFFILAGNFLLYAKGYDNRINLGSFDINAKWEKVEESKLKELEQLNEKAKKWDRSVLDISNPMGAVAFGTVCVILVFVLHYCHTNQLPEMVIAGLDCAALIIPHWLWGLKRIHAVSGFLQKYHTYKNILENCDKHLKDLAIYWFLLLVGKESKVPDDIKIKVSTSNLSKKFLGLYGQIVYNVVQGTQYPYFYVVMVAKKGFGLGKYRRKFNQELLSTNIVSEFKEQDDVEVFVIRQYTTKESGYHTKPTVMDAIFMRGLGLLKTIEMAKRK